MNISTQKYVASLTPRLRRHKELSLTMTRNDIIGCLTRLNAMNKALNKGAENLVESREKLTQMTIGDLRELYIKVTGMILP
jgi:hypothetical protein